MFRTLLESKKVKAKVRESIYEHFGIPLSTYLACSKYMKSKISRLYYDVVVFGKGKILFCFIRFFCFET